MGIDPAPFWANLYLYQFENRFMKDLRSSDFVTARRFHGCSRFIDDLLCVNDKIAFWSSNKHKHFSKNDIKFAIKHLICECYFTIGNSVFIQTIGIPM